MSRVVLVRSTLKLWDLVVVISAGVLASLVGLLSRKADSVPVVPVAGALVALGGAVALWWRRSRLQWVRVNPDGFTLIDSKGETEFNDLQVAGFTLDRRRLEDLGLLLSTTRTVTLWLDETATNVGSKRLQFRTTLQPNEVDPLDELIARLHAQALQQARARLSAGQAFAGNGWRLEGDHLVFSRGPTPLECPLDDISTVTMMDQEVRIWRTGQDEAWAAVKIDGLNAYVLNTLLVEHLRDRPGEEERMSDSENDSESLGRVIFERTVSLALRESLLSTSLMLTLLGVGLIVLGWLNIRLATPEGMQFWGSVVLMAGLACFLWLIYSWRYCFRCHERGLIYQGLLKRRRLLYDHIEAFSYQATRHYMNGRYKGIVFVLDFEPDAEHRSQRIRYSVQLKTSDDELERLRDQISNFLAERMFREIAAGQRVQWTPALAFEQGNLLYTPSGSLGRKPTVSIPWTQIDRYELNQGTCSLFRRGESNVAVSESSSSRNFFPGLFCLLNLMPDQQEESLAIQDFE